MFENPLLAMVTMVTLLALSPLLALPVQTTSLTSSPNSPNFGNGDHVLTTYRRAKEINYTAYQRRRRLLAQVGA